MSVATRKAMYKKMAETENNSSKSISVQSPAPAPSKPITSILSDTINQLSNTKPVEPVKRNVGTFAKTPDIAKGAAKGFSMGLQAADKAISPIIQPIRNWSQTPTGQAVKGALTSGAVSVLPKSKYTEPLQVLGDRGVNSATLGALDYLMPQTQAEKWRQENHPIAATVGTLGGYLIPGIGVEKGIMKALPELAKVAGESIVKQTAKRAAVDALSGGIMGATEGGLNAAVNKQDILKGIAKGGMEGGALGGILGGAIGGVGGKLEANKIFKQGLSKVGDSIDSYKFPQLRDPNILPLPDSMARGPKVSAEIPLKYQQIPKTNEPLMLNSPKGTYLKPLEQKTFTAKSVDTPTTETNIALKNKLTTLKGDVSPSEYSNMPREDLIQLKKEMLNEKGRIFSEQLDFLNSKASRGNKPNQGGVGKDSEGHVVNRFGRISNNELWYRNWAKENSTWDDVNKKWVYRKPTGNEIKEIAEKQLLEGFDSNGGKIPKDGYYAELSDRLNKLDEVLNSPLNKYPSQVNVKQVIPYDVTTLNKKPSFSIGEKLDDLKISKEKKNPLYVDPRFKKEIAGDPTRPTRVEKPVSPIPQVKSEVVKPTIKTTTASEVPVTPKRKYSPEVQTKLDALESSYQQRVANQKKMNFADPQTQSKQLYGWAMEHAAQKRTIIQGDSLVPVDGGFTANELSKEIKRLKTNYSGKEVITPDGEGIATGQMSFGKVGVKYPDGTIKYHASETVTPKVDIDAKINEQKQTLNASKVEPSINSPLKANETTTIVRNTNTTINSTKTVEPSTAPTKTEVNSTKELPEIHKMTAQEFDAHYGLDKKPSQATIENIVEDVGAKVINKVGTKNISEIVKHYQTKYKLPENIKVSYTLEKNTKKGTTNPIRDANGDIVGHRINLNPNQSIEGKVGSLRHEIEHIVDLQSGYLPSANKYKFNPKTDTTGRALYTNASKGHHQQYGWFEPDYLRRVAVKDALKAGQEVPESVLKEFPELKGTKVVDDIKANVDAATKPFKVFESSDVVTQSQPQPPKPNERGFSRNVRTDENMSDKIRDSFETSPEMYDQLANKKTLAEAEGKFAKGYETALKEFETTTTYKPSDVPLSRMLANEAAKRGDVPKARAILSQMAEKLTEAGQLGQAARILRKSDPSVFVSFIERQIIRLNEKGSKIYKDKWKELKLSDAQVKELYSLELYNEDAMEKAMNKVYDNLTEQLPVSKWEKFDSWRRMAMLLNPTTHIRNIGGNALMGGLRKTSDTVGALIQKVFLKPGERTQSFGWSFDKDLKSIVDADWVANKADLTKNNRYDIESLNVMNQDKRIFDTAALEWINNASKNTLEGEDVFFLGRAYRDALGQHMKANGMKQVTEPAREYATRRAYEATFKQVNALSNLIAKGKQIPVAGRFVEAAIPFSKTPSNIAMRSLEYSPLGLMKTLYSAGTKQGAAKVIEDLSKSLTGTALAYLGWQLSSLGWARAAKFQSKNAEGLMTATGDQPYSITTPLGTYTFDWAQPFSVPVAMGMAFHDSMEKNANPNKAIAIEKAVSSAIFAGADTLFSMTMLKSITDAIGGKFGSISEGLASIPVNYLQQAYPAIFGKIARSIDEPQRSTYSDSGLDSFRRQMQAKVPGASKYLEPKLDVFGDELKNVGPAQQFLSPGYGKEIKETSLTKELKRLYETTKESDFLPKVAPYKFEYQGKTIRLSPKELTAFQRNMGRRNEELMDKLVNSPSYTNASRTDKEKMKALATVSSDSYDYAKEILLKDRNIPEDKPESKSKNKKKIIIPGKKQ